MTYDKDKFYYVMDDIPYPILSIPNLIDISEDGSIEELQ